MHTLPPRVQSALAELSRLLRDRFGTRLVFLRLFGSYARGEARPEESDVDVLVVVDDLDFSEHREVVELAARVSCLHGAWLAPLVLSAARWEELGRDDRLLYRELERDGISL